MAAEGAKPVGEGGRGELELLLGSVRVSEASPASPVLFPLGDAGQRGSGSQCLASVGEIAGELQPCGASTPTRPARPGAGGHALTLPFA